MQTANIKGICTIIQSKAGKVKRTRTISTTVVTGSAIDAYAVFVSVLLVGVATAVVVAGTAAGVGVEVDEGEDGGGVVNAVQSIIRIRNDER
jgi:hypothetical protein